MFLFILCYDKYLFYLSRIQIHLMFLFIHCFVDFRGRLNYSNTSHVLIYRGNLFLSSLAVIIQIHLMFLFILGEFRRYYINKLIQIHLMFLFINFYGQDVYEKSNSNTSHVLIYQFLWTRCL